MTKTEKSKTIVEAFAAHEDLGRAIRAVRPWGRAIWIGALGALGVVVAATWYQARHERQEADAQALLATARTPEQWMAIRENHAGTRMAALATLQLAGELARAGNWEAALAEFRAFQDAHGNRFFGPVVEYNIALSLESLGRLEEAVQAYARFEAANPDHYLVPQAILGRARCAVLADRLEAARALYEEFLAAHPESRWTAQAESALQDLRVRTR